ncbi:MAG: single-stranded DNA-binding protein [bacterium]|nr:single-stranded DNA-binding protein [bacterium]
MSSRSLNKVMLIGNLTRDPELRYTPQGTAVCSFGLATNRSWMPSDASERREETEFHRIVSWNKLAELCSQLLTKGRKVYIEGRLQTRSWEGQDGEKRQATEVVAEDMVILDSKREREGGEAEFSESGSQEVAAEAAGEKKETKKATAEKEEDSSESKVEKKSKDEKKEKESKEEDDVIDLDDIPF